MHCVYFEAKLIKSWNQRLSREAFLSSCKRPVWVFCTRDRIKSNDVIWSRVAESLLKQGSTSCFERNVICVIKHIAEKFYMRSFVDGSCQPVVMKPVVIGDKLLVYDVIHFMTPDGSSLRIDRRLEW